MVVKLLVALAGPTGMASGFLVVKLLVALAGRGGMASELWSSIFLWLSPVVPAWQLDM